jgi:hypothetical protein
VKLGNKSLRDYFVSDTYKPLVDADSRVVLDFLTAAKFNLDEARLFSPEKETGVYFSLGPLDLRLGEKVAIVFGCDEPVVLRPISNNEFKLLGSCFADGLMKGEAVRHTAYPQKAQRKLARVEGNRLVLE